MLGWNEIKRIDDKAQNVAKFVFSNDSAVAESVLYNYPDYKTRTVICCSTQSGCPVGCRFCGAGDYFVRNLTADEIVSQPCYLLGQVERDEPILFDEIGRLQIMFMSMGEPLLNLKNLGPALYDLHSRFRRARLLISTIGPDIDYAPVYEFSRAIPTVGLQFSVHESRDEARNKLIPFARKLSLVQIARVGAQWADETGRKPYFNYCAHDSNSSDADADRLLGLFDPDVFCATVSVICERSEGLPATNDHQRKLATDFAAKLVERGFDVRVFDPAGQDTVGGGCGQLWFVQKWMHDNPELAKRSIGAGLPEVHVPRVVA